jgi:hypothetical protein
MEQAEREQAFTDHVRDLRSQPVGIHVHVRKNACSESGDLPEEESPFSLRRSPIHPLATMGLRFEKTESHGASALCLLLLRASRFRIKDVIFKTILVA